MRNFKPHLVPHFKYRLLCFTTMKINPPENSSQVNERLWTVALSISNMKHFSQIILSTPVHECSHPACSVTPDFIGSFISSVSTRC